LKERTLIMRGIAWQPAQLEGTGLALAGAGSPALVPNPEPGTLVVLGSALAATGALERRRRRR
jgi:hypothetical protein